SRSRRRSSPASPAAAPRGPWASGHPSPERRPERCPICAPSSSPPRRYRSLESRHKAGLYRSGKNYVDRLNIFSGLLKDLNLDVREPTTTSGALTPKPPEYVSQFWDRWSLFTELVIPAWPVHAPVRPTNNGRCDYARLRARLKFPRGARMDRARIARAHRLRSKAIFPAIWSSGI